MSETTVQHPQLIDQAQAENVYVLDLTLPSGPDSGELVTVTDHEIYEGVQLKQAGGRTNMTTPPAEAMNIVGRNVAGLVSSINQNVDTVKLTGAVPIWLYMSVFHAVVHRFKTVTYSDGRGIDNLVISQHG